MRSRIAHGWRSIGRRAVGALRLDSATYREVSLDPDALPQAVAIILLSSLVSAIVFLVSGDTEVATTYIIGRVVNGDYGVAIAYCAVLILIMVLAIVLVQWLVGSRKLGRRSGAQPAVAPVAVGG